MNISIMDVLTLEDKNEYVVVSKVLYEDKNYMFLVDINNNKNVKFCYQDNDEVVESDDKDLNSRLLPLFYEQAKAIIESINEE